MIASFGDVFAGMLFVVIGLFVMMVIDTHTNRVSRMTGNHDGLIFVMLFAWPLVLPFLFLRRYSDRSSPRSLYP